MIVTIATVGYGDINPNTLTNPNWTKLWAILFMLGSVFSFAVVVSTAVNLRAAQLRRKRTIQMIHKDVDSLDFNRFLEIADVNGDGKLDGMEFTFVILDELNLLSEEADLATLLAIQSEFERADKDDDGYIDWGDIVASEGKDKTQESMHLYEDFSASLHATLRKMKRRNKLGQIKKKKRRKKLIRSKSNVLPNVRKSGETQAKGLESITENN
mmetsp:Transcript_19205/g.47076  ORF Transcript_19205/g.47076 Transcript_19205/m.47076 type:complete len:213 (-) Transcript_19205:271-909(-)